MILKGTVYKRDFLEFLDHPVARIAKARYYATDSAGWYYGYGGVDKNLAGLQIDWQHKTVQFPDRIPEKRAQTRSRANSVSDASSRRGPPDRLSALLVRPDHRSLPRLRHQADLSARAARAGFPSRCSAQTRTAPSGRSRPQPNVIVLDERLFDQLEHPDLFWDGWHLNREGMEQFSQDSRGRGAPRPGAAASL